MWLGAGPAQPGTVLGDICDLDVMTLCYNAKIRTNNKKRLEEEKSQGKGVSVLQDLLSSPQQINLSSDSCGMGKPRCDFAISDAQSSTLQGGFFFHSLHDLPNNLYIF